MLDLDGFKDVNERLGHAAGDRYLRELGATVKGRLRAADVGCRYGGDELAVLLPETDLAAAGTPGGAPPTDRGASRGGR